MTHKTRLLLMAVLPAALIFAGCKSQSGISGTGPDSGTPGAAHPDSAVSDAVRPDSATPDAATPSAGNPDSGTPDSARPDSATPDATPDAAIPDAATPDAATPGTATPDSATYDGDRNNSDIGGPPHPVDAKTDAEFVHGDTSLPSPIDAGDSGSSVGRALITVNPPSVDLGVVDLGMLSWPVSVTVTNVGTAMSGSLYVTISGANITVSGCSGAVLAPADTCQISIRAIAPASGPISGTVEVGDSLANTKKIAVSGIVMGRGQLALAPSSLDLGAVLAGKTVTGTIVLTNTSATDLTGIVMTFAGAGYTRSLTGDCTDTLAAGQSCNIDVSFTAGSTSGAAKGFMTVSQGGVSKSVALTATVQMPAKFVMTPTSASLQTVVGTPSSPVTFYVANAGDVSSAIPLVSIRGFNKDDFSFVSTCALALPGGATGSCQITVVYNPKTAPTTKSSATLVVAEPDPGASVSATLTGMAVPASSLRLTASSTDFGTVIVGNTSTASTVTLSNAGGEDSGAIKLVGSDPRFVIVTDYCTARDLGPGQSCTFTLRFTPLSGDLGVFQGQIKATADNTANPCFLSFAGSAVPPPH